MIQIEEELWKMYHGSSVPKQLYIVFPNVTLDNSHIFDFSMEESLSSDTDILFGSCEATQFKARVEGVGKDIVGKKCRIYHIVDEQYEMPLGTYIIDSVSKKDDLGYREIIGYDEIYTKLSIDVTDWYKSLAFPMSLKTFRQSLFSYVGIPIVDQELIQDDLKIEHTIDPNALNGRSVAQAIGELNGTFGHIGRDGTFKYVHLGNVGLYPAEDLYPSEDLFPSDADSQFDSSASFSCVREEYEVSGIDCLQIRQQEGDVGSVTYDSLNYKNPYIVTGNFLIYGKTAAQLNQIGRILFDYIKYTPYTPYTARVIGLPYLEVGDGITFSTKKDNFLSYVMKRKLSGIQSFRDELSATGNQYRDNEVSPNNEIKMLKGKSMIIQKSVEGLKVVVSDLEADTNSKFEQTANRITAEVASINKDMTSRFEITNNAITAEVKRATDEEGKLSGRIDVTARDITLEVNRATKAEGDLSAKIKIEADRITSEVTRATGAEGQLSSKITQTASEIRSEVKNTTDGLSSSISQTASSINTRITNEVSGLNSSISQTASGLTTKIENTETGLRNELNTTAESLTSEITSLDGQFSKIEQTVNGVTISGPGGSTAISGDSVYTGTLKSIQAIFDAHNAVYWVAGTNSISDTTGGDWACTSDAFVGNYNGRRTIQLYREDGNIRISGTLYCEALEVDGVNISGGGGGGSSDGYWDMDGGWLATSDDVWCKRDLWVDGTFTEQSDIRSKYNINYEDDKLEEIIDLLNPVSYKMKNDPKNKLRFGFVAQDIKKIMETLYKNEEPIYSYDKERDIYSLSYIDIIAPLVAKVQHMQKEIKELRKIIHQGETK